jgi:hypothetical protein
MTTPSPSIAEALENAITESGGIDLNNPELLRQAAALIRSQAADLEAARARCGELEEGLRGVNRELWWCAIQLGCDWKDAKWRADSSVGRAYDKARALNPEQKP